MSSVWHTSGSHLGNPVPLAGSAALITFSILHNKGFGNAGEAINIKRNKSIFPVDFMLHIFLNWFTYTRIQTLYNHMVCTDCTRQTYSEISDTVGCFSDRGGFFGGRSADD